MKVLGIDPGDTTGWCVYDSENREVVAAGCSRGLEAWAEIDRWLAHVDAVAIERPRGYGATYPQVVEAGYVCGYLVASILAAPVAPEPVEIVRREVCRLLTDAVDGAVRVKNDSTAWAALCELHGGAGVADLKPKRRKGVVVESGGPLGEVRSHARAALAVAVAFSLRTEQGAA